MWSINNTIYAISCLLFSIVIGAGIYETIAVWPNAFSSPPQSLTMFQGDYSLNSGPFWTTIHPLILISFIFTLIVSWKTARRINILVVFIIYSIIMAITLTYFVPELVAITGSQFSETTDPDLLRRAKTWINLNYLRAVFLPVMGIYLYLGLTKPE